MISLNLLESTAPAYQQRTYGMSKRFIIITGFGTLILSLLVFFLEVIFAAFNIGDGSLLVKQETAQIMVSKDEFSILNREHATAPLVFNTLIKQTPGDANFKLMKLVNSHRLIAQGLIASKASGEAMFEDMKASGLWEVLNAQVYEKKSSSDKYYKFQFVANFIPTVNEDYTFKSVNDFPSTDSIARIIDQFYSLGKELGFTTFEKPIIEKTIEETTLFEYQYSLSTKSSYKVFHTFLTEVYERKLPIIFQDITLKPSGSGIDSKIIFRVLTN